MDIKGLVELFQKASASNHWGEMSYIMFLDDGSGEVVSEDEQYDGDTIFEFNTPDELVKNLEKSIK